MPRSIDDHSAPSTSVSSDSNSGNVSTVAATNFSVNFDLSFIHSMDFDANPDNIQLAASWFHCSLLQLKRYIASLDNEGPDGAQKKKSLEKTLNLMIRTSLWLQVQYAGTIDRLDKKIKNSKEPNPDSVTLESSSDLKAIQDSSTSMKRARDSIETSVSGLTSVPNSTSTPKKSVKLQIDGPTTTALSDPIVDAKAGPSVPTPSPSTETTLDPSANQTCQSVKVKLEKNTDDAPPRNDLGPSEIARGSSLHEPPPNTVIVPRKEVVIAGLSFSADLGVIESMLWEENIRVLEMRRLTCCNGEVSNKVYLAVDARDYDRVTRPDIWWKGVRLFKYNRRG